eukprot:755716-Hanusia_phi.AAC.3
MFCCRATINSWMKAIIDISLSLQNKPKKPAAKPGTPEYKEYERLVKRLNKIRIDAQDFKKRTDMENEIKEYRRRIKDLESRSTIPRNASKRTEDGKVLERGELIRSACCDNDGIASDLHDNVLAWLTKTKRSRRSIRILQQLARN